MKLQLYCIHVSIVCENCVCGSIKILVNYSEATLASIDGACVMMAGNVFPILAVQGNN